MPQSVASSEFVYFKHKSILRKLRTATSEAAAGQASAQAIFRFFEGEEVQGPWLARSCQEWPVLEFRVSLVLFVCRSYLKQTGDIELRIFGRYWMMLCGVWCDLFGEGEGEDEK